MAFHYRNLLNESIEDSITSFCAPYCEPEKNQLGLCPLTCISFCYPTCNRPFLAAIPPPLPDHITTLDDHHADKQYKSSQFLAISLAILVIAFFFFFCYTICKFCAVWYNSRREASELQPQEEGPDEFLDQDLEPEVYHPIWYIRSVGLQPSVISSITICKYKKGDRLVEGTECAVCLNEFREDETLRLLPKCNHAFHIPCIDTWLTSHINCPICRADIVLNPVSLPSPEQNVNNSGVLEEMQDGVSENEREFEMEREHESCESRVEHEAEGKSQAQTALKINQDSMEESEKSDSREVEGVQPLRRSVSLDTLSASLISAATANAYPIQSDKQVNKVNESSEGVITNRVADKSLSRIANCWTDGSEQMKRSLSCSEKQFLSRHSRRWKASKQEE